VKLRVGVGISNLPAASARGFFAWADLCEASEIDSIWQTDRLVSSQPFLESLAAMAALAGATERVKFGMNAVVAPLRDPLLLAKQCATIDWLSGGRLLPVFGVGGEHAPEFRATGRSAAERGRRADEVLEIARRLWSEESVTFHGEFYRYEGVTIAPRPIQQPLPLWIGGSSPAAIRRTVRLGTGWLGGVQTPAQVAPVVAAIKKLGHESGRPIPEDHYGASFAFRLGPQDDALVGRAFAARARAAGADFDPKAYFALGDAQAVLERVAQYRAVGVSKFVLIPLVQNEAELLEQTRRLAAEVLPVAHGWEA
ncbi:MAG TPA: TIGR03619 family F420-dependent LLM class oxidoreductase, partial [Myxococcota bacterium]|nr:TIGR03619 family F420-dependent LLM class oxidoreductase [Myxococcota bacterium]